MAVENEFKRGKHNQVAGIAGFLGYTELSADGGKALVGSVVTQPGDRALGRFDPAARRDAVDLTGLQRN